MPVKHKVKLESEGITADETESVRSGSVTLTSSSSTNYYSSFWDGDDIDEPETGTNELGMVVR
jgi:hypothetical protein